MEVLFIVVNDLSYMDKILGKMLELKVRGATILDSEGMARAIMREEGFNFLLSGPFQQSASTKGSKTIFTVISDLSKKDLIIESIHDILSESDIQGAGFMFTIPVSGIYPIKPKQAK